MNNLEHEKWMADFNREEAIRKEFKKKLENILESNYADYPDLEKELENIRKIYDRIAKK